MSWSDFELLTGEYFRNRGFRVEETREGADGGVDLVVYRNDLKFLVQCKHWKSASIGVKVVRELLGVVVATGAAGGYVICSGRFTKEATRFARENSIQLLGKQELSDILSGNTDPHNIQEASKVTPVCPECGKKMVRRVARKGSRIGQEFWGCSDFPKCRGIR
jgi:restriction system protein